MDYEEWLKRPGQSRVLLVEANTYSGGSEVTRYLATKSKKSFGYYDAAIDAVPVMSRKLSQAFGGHVLPGAGTLDLLVEDRHRSWIFDHWGNRTINFLHGDEDWDRSDFVRRYAGKVLRMEVASDSTYRIHFSDRHAELNVPIQSDTFTSGDAKGQVKPLCYGYPKNITPVLIDKTTHRYKVHDGVVEDVCVTGTLRVNGSTTGVPTVTKYNSLGEFTLSADPNGTVTCDTKGAKPATWLQKPGEIIEDIVTRLGPMSASDLDSTSFTDYDTGAPNISLYIKARRNMLQVLDEVIATRLGWYGIARTGLFFVGRLTDPVSGTSTIDLDTANTNGDLNLTVGQPPRWKTTLGYGKNWTVLNQSTQGETVKAWLQQEYKEVVYEDAAKTTIQSEYIDASAPTMEKTLIDSEADALAEATSRQGLFNKQRYWVQPDVSAIGLFADIGEVGTVTDDVVGLSAQKFLITQLNDDMASGRVRVGGWF